MKKTNEGDLAFDYIQKLCQAIENFTQSQEHAQPNIFQYCGADLKYAVERALYFSAVDNKRLRSFFRLWVQQQLPKTSYFGTTIERDLAFHLCDGKVNASCLQVRYEAFYSFYIRQRRLIFQQLLRLEPGIEQGLPEDMVFLAIDHVKFARFLRPIVEKLPISCSYLLHCDWRMGGVRKRKKLQDYLINNQFRFVNLRPTRRKLEKELPLFWQDVISYYDYYYATLSATKPQCVIVIEGNHVQDEIINQVGKQLSIPVICLQQGWSPIIHNGFRNMSYTKMLVWGEGFVDLLQPHNPEQQFVVTGSHVISGKQSFLNQADKGISFFLQSPNKLGTIETWNQFLELIRWTAQEFSDVPVLVREHPQFPLAIWERNKLQKYANIKFVPSSRYSLATVLDQSLLVVAIYSTTILEGIAAGVLPLIFNVTSLPSYFPDVQAASAGIEVKDLDAAKQVISRAIVDSTFVQQFESSIKRFRNQYFARGDRQKAIEKTIQEITEVVTSLARQEKQ